MKKKVRVLTPIEIPNLEKYIDMNFMRQELNNYLNIIISDINIQDLEDWNLLILINSRATSGIGVFKRAKRFPSDKEFEVSISISIPNEKQIFYGIPEVNEAYFHPLNDKKFYILQPEFNNYSDLGQFFLASSKQAIDLAFIKGFTCNSKKIKFQK